MFAPLALPVGDRVPLMAVIPPSSAAFVSPGIHGLADFATWDYLIRVFGVRLLSETN